MSFTICNNSSINLNFIIHVLHMYNKIESYSKDEFLDMEELECNMINLWNSIIGSFQNVSSKTANGSFVQWDRSLVLQKDLYKVLFKDTEAGYNKFLSIWDNYFEWWYREGQSTISQKTDDVISSIYDLVNDKLIKSNLKPTGDFGIQIVFDAIPNKCLSKGSIFTIESISNFIDENKIIEVSERLYELICSTIEK